MRGEVSPGRVTLWLSPIGVYFLTGTHTPVLTAAHHSSSHGKHRHLVKGSPTLRARQGSEEGGGEGSPGAPECFREWLTGGRDPGQEARRRQRLPGGKRQVSISPDAVRATLAVCMRGTKHSEVLPGNVIE